MLKRFSSSLSIIWRQLSEIAFQFQETFSQYNLNADVLLRANRHTSTDHDLARRDKYYMWVSHIFEIVIDMLYAGHLVTLSCAIYPPTILLQYRL